MWEIYWLAVLAGYNVVLSGVVYAETCKALRWLRPRPERWFRLAGRLILPALWVTRTAVTVGGIALFGRLAADDPWAFARAYGILTVPAFLLYSAIGATVYRWRGFTFAYRTDTRLQRTRTPRPRPGEEAVVQLQSRWFLPVTGMALGFLAVGMGAFVGSTPHHVIDGPTRGMSSESAYLLCILFAAGSVASWWGHFTGAGASAVADELGLRRPTPFGIGKRIPWEQIGGCTIETHRDLLGRVSSTTCRFGDREGRPLFTVNLGSGVRPAQREAFLALVRQCHTELPAGPTELIAAAAPAGVGTELVAGAAPLGTGTELTAVPTAVSPDTETEASVAPLSEAVAPTWLPARER